MQGAEGASMRRSLRKRGKDIVLVAEDGDVGGLIPAWRKERIERVQSAQGFVLYGDGRGAEFGVGRAMRFCRGEEPVIP